MAKNEIEQRDLLDEAKFIEMLAHDPIVGGVDLDYWQVGYARDRHPFIVMRKSRRVGYSFIEALTGLIRSQIEIRKTVPYVYAKYFISRNLDESKEKIMFANYFHDLLPRAYRLRKIVEQKTELIFEDNRGRRTRLKALTAQPPRGQGGDVNIDEAAWIRDMRKIYESALFLIGENPDMQITIGSSPAGQNGLFYEIETNHKDEYDDFNRYAIPWWLSRNLCIDVPAAAKHAPKMTTKERVASFGTSKLQMIHRQTTHGNFARESEILYSDESSTYMPYALIQECTKARCSDIVNDPDAEYFFEYFRNEVGVVGKQEPGISFWEKLRAIKKGYYQAGYDIGRTGHMSAMCIVEVVHGHKYVRALVRLNDCPFPIQEKVIKDMMRVVRPLKLNIDRRGIGMQLAESAKREYGSMVTTIAQSNPVNAELAAAVKKAFEAHEISIPDHQEFIDHIHSIEQHTHGNTDVFDATAEGEQDTDIGRHHGDFFWALGFTYFEEAKASSGSYAAKGTRLPGVVRERFRG